MEGYCLASMGNYAFNPRSLLEELVLDGKREFTTDGPLVKESPETFSKNDFGFDIIPSMLRNNRRVFVYNFRDNRIDGEERKTEPYWRDVGSPIEFFNTSMEVALPREIPNAHHPNWPIHTYMEVSTPAKNLDGNPRNSVSANGTVIYSGNVNGSILSYNSIIDGADITDTILMGNNYVGKGANLYRTIVDKGVIIPAGTSIGRDLEHDNKRGFRVDFKNKITIVPEGYKFE